jgi:hypothetical protein
VVMSTNFAKMLPEFSTKSEQAPRQMVWCGVDSVMLYWDEVLLMVGPYGDWVKYTYDQPLVLAPVRLSPPPALSSPPAPSTASTLPADRKAVPTVTTKWST